VKILVTGSNGYIASALIPELLNKGYEVKGLDLDLMDKPNIEFTQGDIRDVGFIDKQIKGMDAVIHLAAVVPPSKLESELESINIKGTNRLVQLCRARGIQRVFFASSTSVYGNGVGLNEWDKPKKGKTSHAPNTEYVSGKICCENFILSLRNDTFNPVVFRFATVFGSSKKISWQSLFNSFVKEAVETKEIKMYHPNAYRPFCHVKDIAQGIVKALEFPSEVTSGQIYNIGGYNATKLELVELIKEQIPELKVNNFGGNDIGYSVDFNRIKEIGLNLTHSLKDGITELKEALNGVRVL
jgi:nucleoside-diphosphate-sugar epimerase